MTFLNIEEAKGYFFKTMKSKGMTDEKEIEDWWKVFIFSYQSTAAKEE